MRRIKLLFITFLIFVVCFGCSGCHQMSDEKFMEDYMHSIPPEFSGYALKDYDNEDNNGFIKYVLEETSVVIDTKTVVYRRQNNDNSTRADENHPYEITIDNVNLILNCDYLATHSDAYNKITHLWNQNDKNNEVLHYNIQTLFVFDGKLFLSVCQREIELVKNWRGDLPTALFYFDVNDYSVKYVGYCSQLKYQNLGYIHKVN